MTGQTMNAAQARVIDPILTEHARGYSNAEFIGFNLFPRVNMRTRAAKRLEFNREALRRLVTRRAPGSNLGRFTMSYRGVPVNLTQDGLQAVTPVEFVDEASEVPGIDLQMESVSVVMDVINLATEIIQAETARDAANYAASNRLALAGADRFTDPNSDPEVVIADAVETVRARSAKRPNTLALGPNVFRSLKVHPKIRDHFKRTSSAAISAAMLAEYFDIPNVYVGDAIYDVDDASSADVWGDDAILAYVPMEGQRSMRQPSYGYTYELPGHPFVEQTMYDYDSRSWKNNVINENSPELVGSDSGFLIQNAGQSG